MSGHVVPFRHDGPGFPVQTPATPGALHPEPRKRSTAPEAAVVDVNQASTGFEIQSRH